MPFSCRSYEGEKPESNKRMEEVDLELVPSKNVYLKRKEPK